MKLGLSWVVLVLLLADVFQVLGHLFYQCRHPIQLRSLGQTARVSLKYSPGKGTRGEELLRA